MSKYKIEPLLPQKINTYSLRSRKSKVSIAHFARPFAPGRPFQEFVESLPQILAGNDFREFLALLRRAREEKKAILYGLGAQVIKVGLSPVIIDLLKEGWITALALNGAGIIHDFELAYAGHTSEEVGVQIRGGRFGMARETGEKLNEAICGAGEEMGLGESVGRMISRSGFPHKDFSLLAAAYELNIPVTVHVAIGTDIIHFHPSLKGESLGKAALRDFFLFCSLVERLEGGGVFVNIGSAVVLPEVFLKAVSFVRNRGAALEDFSAAVFDFIHHYRPYQNVVKRPLGRKGKGFYFIGHHEIMIPLLAAALKSDLSR